MPSPTYDLIEEKVLGSAAASVTFSSIPGTYKDLVLEIVGTVASGSGQAIYLRMNGDTASNYSTTYVFGNGTSAVTGRSSNSTFILSSRISSLNVANGWIAFQSYANTNVNKTVISRGDNSAEMAVAYVGLWRSTSAITSITLTPESASNFLSGTTARLWGVSG